MAMTLNKLMKAEQSLTPNEREIMLLLRKSRVLLASQIRTLLYTGYKTENTALRCVQRTMSHLKDVGLVDTLDRRITGHRLGSASNIWHLTEQGYRLLALEDGDPSVRHPFVVPSYLTLKHKLCVADYYVQMVELTRKHPKLSIKEYQFEPDTWRDYHPASNSIKLKPDFFLVTEDGEYEYRYFIEIDLSTESVQEIIKKCDRYHAYLNTEQEQKKYGVFPLVVWIVRDENRKEKLIEAISKEYASRYHIFQVITQHELETAFTQEPNPEKLI